MVFAMSQDRFQPDKNDQAVLNRTWMVLGAILVQLATLLESACDNDGVNAFHRLCRVGESLARRWLLTKALAGRLPAISKDKDRSVGAATRLRRPRYAPHDVRYQPPQTRHLLFRLAEPLPGFGEAPRAPRQASTPILRVETHGILTVRIHSTAGVPDWRQPVRGASTERL